MKAILALDLGTTGNRAIAFSKEGQILASAYYEFPQYFPQPAWVEHDPMEIWETAKKALAEVIAVVGIQNCVSLGITNQRETTVIWNKKTGTPIYNAIVWQCRRTSDMCEKLAEHHDMIKKKTGLFLDPYFSATKIAWILNQVDGAQDLAESGDLLFGTIDSWMTWQLTGGAQHVTDASNASRTMLYNICDGQYDPELLSLFNIPDTLLPEVKNSQDDFGVIEASLFGLEIPISAILGDQQAALFAQCGNDQQAFKNTYGTGLFIVANTGSEIPESARLINTVAWQIDGKRTYALEGSVFIGGSAIQWLRDQLQLINSAEETEALALSISDNEGVYFVPALSGLGAPHWDPNARGLLIGLTR
ncbi:MAG: glycerol kinase, partial [Candidatus Marinamargulisbacteria bacterium]